MEEEVVEEALGPIRLPQWVGDAAAELVAVGDRAQPDGGAHHVEHRPQEERQIETMLVLAAKSTPPVFG